LTSTSSLRQRCFVAFKQHLVELLKEREHQGI